MSASSGPIQQIPKGLLGLLQLKNLGRNPDVLQGFVQPVVDMLPFWLQATQEIDPVPSTRALATSNGQVLSFTTNALVVPEGELWWVHDYTVQAALPAAAGELIINLSPVLILNAVGALRFVQLTEIDKTINGSAVTAIDGMVNAKAFFAPPTSVLGFHHGGVVTATAINVAGYASITRLQI